METLIENLPCLDLETCVYRCYSSNYYRFVRINQFRLPGVGWTNEIRGHSFESLELVSVEQQIEFLQRCGVTVLQLELYNFKTKRSIYPDFALTEIIKN